MWTSHLCWTERLFAVPSVETDVSLPAPVNSAHPHALQGAASSEPVNLCLAKLSPPPPAPPPPLQALQGAQLAMASSH